MYAKLHAALVGVLIHDLDGNQVYKFELWERHRHSMKDLESIMAQTHPDYRFSVNDEYWDFMRKRKKNKK